MRIDCMDPTADYHRADFPRGGTSHFNVSIAPKRWTLRIGVGYDVWDGARLVF